MQRDEGLQQQCRDMAAGLGMPRLAGTLSVYWNPRMRSAAGRAFLQVRRIELNPLLREHGEGEVERTLKHELAHLIVHEQYGRRCKPHGPEWQLACAALGIPGEISRHALPLPRRTLARKFQYRCPSCEATVSRVRPLRGSTACFRCCRNHNAGVYTERFRLIRCGSDSDV
jgi:predicted SprT family Zn-dependent metalloprotease